MDTFLQTDAFRLSEPVYLDQKNAREPDVTVGQDGTPHVIWVRQTRDGDEIFLSRFADGKLVPVLLSDCPGVALQPSVCADRHGSIMTCWVSRTQGIWRLLTRSVADGVTSEMVVLAENPEGIFSPQLCALPDGGCVLVYESVSGGIPHIKTRRFSGNRWSSEQLVGFSDRACYRPTIAVSALGDVWMSFDTYKDGTYGAYLQQLNGKTAPVEVAADSFQNLQTSVTIHPDGAIWVAWASNRNPWSDPWWLTKWISVRSFAEGKVLEPVGVQTDRDVLNEDFLQGWEFPAVTAGSDGQIWIFGQSSHGLFGQSYDENGWSARFSLAEPNWGSWKPRIRVAGDGPIWITSMDLNGARLQRLDLQSGNPGKTLGPLARVVHHKPFKTEPIRHAKTKTDEGYCYFFGDLHAHSVYSDATGDVDEFYHRYRDAYGVDFAALTDHDYLDGIELSRSELEMIWNHADRLTENGRFVALCGYEWTSPALSDHAGEGAVVGEGHRHVLYPGNDGPLVSYGEPDVKTGRRLLERLSGTRCLVIPHHTAWSGTDLDAADDSIQRLIEVCSIHGRFEYPGNRPVGYRRDHVHPGKYVLDALKKGHRLGFTGGSDSHGLRWHATEMEGRARHIPAGTRVGWKEDAYRGGMTVVLAEALSREGIFDALFHRRCYATTGERIVLDFRINGSIMGTEITCDGPPAISARAVGTDVLRSVEILREGQVISGLDARTGSSFSQIEIQTSDATIIPGQSTWYYLRVTQEDGNMAWSSPIWVNPI